MEAIFKTRSPSLYASTSYYCLKPVIRAKAETSQLSRALPPQCAFIIKSCQLTRGKFVINMVGFLGGEEKNDLVLYQI